MGFLITSSLLRRASYLKFRVKGRFYTGSVPMGTDESNFIIPQKFIRNVAIIAHVDHGKTTLVDCLLQQSGSATGSIGERHLDHNVLERERGITILSKATSIRRGQYRINIVDTPGHADFGGEVERVLSMVDGVALLVDATEGPMAQTKFVLSKALRRGLQPIVVLNKVDRGTARLDEVDTELMDLFSSLGASDEQMDYKILYASAREGWAVSSNPSELLARREQLKSASSSSIELEKVDESLKGKKMDALFDAIIENIPSPNNDRSLPFSMLVNNMEVNPYLGKCFLGKIQTGIVRVGDKIKAIFPSQTDDVLDEEVEGSKKSSSVAPVVLEEGRCLKIFIRRGAMEQEIVKEAAAGDIVSIAGISNASIHSTICAPEVEEPIPFTPVDPPTLSMVFSINSSPLAGKEGKSLTTQSLRQRIMKELETNVSLKMRQASSADSYEVFGRGELQLGVFIETMRREGCELLISPPKVVFKKQVLADGRVETLEPIEQLVIDTDEQYTSVIIDKLNKRKGELLRIIDDYFGKVRILFEIPTRGLIGYASEFKNDTHGTGLMTNSLLRYDPYRGQIDLSRKGAIISMAAGVATAHALHDIESRGTLFIGNGTATYPGMIIGETNKNDDVFVNPCKTKQLTNIRAVSKDEAIRLNPPKIMSLEESIAYLASDEMLEVTPKTLRLRKAILDPSQRKRKSTD